ncbi:MAG: glutathione S-transferase family protein [Maricaulaceae bacterium]|jgi:glutathione S-transferase
MNTPILIHSALGLDSHAVRLVLAEKAIEHRALLAAVAYPRLSTQARLHALRPDADLPMMLTGDAVAVGVAEILDCLGLTSGAGADLLEAFPDWEIEIGLRRGGKRAPQTDVAGIEAQLRRIEALVEQFDERLSDGGFANGVGWTVADAIWTAMLARLRSLGLQELFENERLPRVRAYFSRMRRRPSFRAAHVRDRSVSLIELAALQFRIAFNAHALSAICGSTAADAPSRPLNS